MNTPYERIVFAFDSSGLGATQVRIAQRLGITQGAVGTWKRGGEISHGVMSEIVRLTGFREEWLRHGHGPMRPGHPKIDAIVDELSKLSPTQLDAALKIIEALRQG